MKNVSSMCKAISLAAVLAVGICLTSGGAFAGDADINGPTVSPSSVAPLVTPAKPTNGSVKCTAAVNSNASILSCKNCNPADTTHIGTGSYQVGFNKPCQNILAVNGWSRWVQPDTLGIGSEVAFCTTADRSGDANAVFVRCSDASGPVDASFFLFVAK